MRLRSFLITESSPFVGLTMQECGIRDRYNCMVVGVEEGKENLSQVKPSYRFRQGDIIWVVGEADDLVALLSASR